jgi:hypothetical protein
MFLQVLRQIFTAERRKPRPIVGAQVGHLKNRAKSHDPGGMMVLPGPPAYGFQQDRRAAIELTKRHRRLLLSIAGGQVYVLTRMFWSLLAATFLLVCVCVCRVPFLRMSWIVRFRFNSGFTDHTSPVIFISYFIFSFSQLERP